MPPYGLDPGPLPTGVGLGVLEPPIGVGLGVFEPPIGVGSVELLEVALLRRFFGW